MTGVPNQVSIYFVPINLFIFRYLQLVNLYRIDTFNKQFA